MADVCPGCGLHLTSNDMPYKEHCPYCGALLKSDKQQQVPRTQQRSRRFRRGA